ncbi:MAG: LysR family transcriptional regulator [Janthinobacterium lividum]
MIVNQNRTIVTLDQLRIFVAVAERDHLTRAAAALAMTPSAISSAIRLLEERYGTVLFNRVGRGIELSEAGRIFLPEARLALASARAAELTLAELGQGRRGSLSLQASQTIASYWLPAMLVKFHQAYPDVDIQLEVGNSQSVARAVAGGAAEIGFVEDRNHLPDLVSRAIAQDQFAVVVAPGHPWADGNAVAPQALLEGTWIMREQGSGTRSAFEVMLADLGVHAADLRIALVLPSNESVRSAVVAGPFASVASTLVVAADLAAGLLCKVNIGLPARAFHLLHHATRHRSKVSIAFEEMLLQTMA